MTCVKELIAEGVIEHQDKGGFRPDHETRAPSLREQHLPQDGEPRRAARYSELAGAREDRTPALRPQTRLESGARRTLDESPTG